MPPTGFSTLISVDILKLSYPVLPGSRADLEQVGVNHTRPIVSVSAFEWLPGSSLARPWQHDGNAGFPATSLRDYMATAYGWARSTSLEMDVVPAYLVTGEDGREQGNGLAGEFGKDTLVLSVPLPYMAAVNSTRWDWRTQAAAYFHCE